MKRYSIPRFVALCAVAAVLSGTALAGEEAQIKPADAQPATDVKAAPEVKSATDAQPATDKPAAPKEAQAKDAPAKEEPGKEPQSKEPPARESAVVNSALVKAQGKLAISMLKQLGGGKKGAGASVVVSPSSLAGALSVIELGASEELKASIPRVLGFDDSPMLWAELNTLRSITSHAPDGAPYTIANAIVIDDSAQPSPSVVDALTSTGIETKVRPFSKPETLQELNAWVEKQTNKLIPTIIDKMPESGGLVTLNALYFKDHWKKTFNPSLTKATPFRMVGGKTVDSQMMLSDDGKFKFFHDKDFEAVELPYATDGYFISIVTTKGEPGSIEKFSLAADLLTGKGYNEENGDVRIPRLDLSGNNNLKGTILELMKGKSGNVTVSRFTSKPVQLANAQQRVVLKLDEEGTEAAAATAVTAKRGLDTDTRYFHFLADRPFVFALRDAKTGLILVAGYVAQPT